MHNRIITGEYIQFKRELLIQENSLKENIINEIIYYSTPKVKNVINSLKDNYYYDENTFILNHFCLESSLFIWDYSFDTLLVIHFFINKAIDFILTEKQNRYDLFKIDIKKQHPNLPEKQLRLSFLFIDYLEKNNLQLPDQIISTPNYFGFEWGLEDMEVSFLNTIESLDNETFYYTFPIPNNRYLNSSSIISRIPNDIYEYLSNFNKSFV